jgi:sugar/nucleoside kinase (ribokinase family)
LKKEWFQRTRLLHVDGEYLAASRLAARWARESGVPVMCDLDVFSEDLHLLLAHVDFPVLSAGLLQSLAGSPDPLVALPYIRARHSSRMVCTTMGERGALAWDGQRFWYAPAVRVKVVDTTGAGDLFHAGFAYGILKGWDTQHTLEFGCAAAGLNCTAHGARGCISSPRAIERLRAGKLHHPDQYSTTVLGSATERALIHNRGSAATKG